MPITIEWVDQPHILQLIMQGYLTVDQLYDAWAMIADLHNDCQAEPLCLLTVVLPDRNLPLGWVNAAQHPAARTLKLVHYHAMVGVDHVVMGMLIEALENLPFRPKFERHTTYEDGLLALRQRIHAAKL